MKKQTLSLFLILPFFLAAQKDLTTLVNPFVGTGGHGHTFPGATLPFGGMQLSPDTRMADWDGSSGYHYSDSVIYGFSHTHLSGTGIPDYCDVLLMPFSGAVAWEPAAYRSAFSHAEEKASPGYYEVRLKRQNIRAQLSTALRSGLHQYTFPATEKDGAVLLDLQHRDEVLESWIEKVSDTEIRGMRRSRSWAQNQVLYFTMRFDRPLQDWGILNEAGQVVKTGRVEGKKLKAFFRFALPADRQLRVKVGISGVSAEGAALNLQEIPDWNFARLAGAAKAAWNRELSRIELKGGRLQDRQAFYSALYHTFIVPNVYQDADGQYRGTDGQVHRASGFVNHSVFSLWDTYRAYHPLMTILQPKRTTDWINTFLAQYRAGGMLPVWELSGNETFCMIGYHSVPVIVDAYQKGIRGFDANLALEAARSYAESDRFGLDAYRALGYIPNDREHESVSKTLEYAYDDWCIAQLAKALGQDSVYRQYSRRAQFYKNVFDPQTRHMRGKVQARWHTPFEPREINNFFTEGNAWQYSFAVPQDIRHLAELYGGEQGFRQKLEALFAASSQTTGREQADVTGLIGQYAQGNEPSHHMAYLFSFAGQPWRTQELIHKICREFYLPGPDGLIGNEDCGQMSAWYLFSAMGFYPVCPGTGEYVIGTPLFDEVKIHLENGKDFTIRAGRTSPDAFYVQGVSLNGKPLPQGYLRHDALVSGGLLQFTLGATPNKSWGAAAELRPHSSIDGEPIVAVPFFTDAGNKFRDEATVSLQSPTPGARLFYREKTPAGDNAFKSYSGSFRLRASAVLEAYAEKDGRRSAVVTQQYYRLPNNFTITVLSKLNPLYTAGGPEALLDGIEGGPNWRSGEWQGYFDQDFEAVVDLQKTLQVGYAGIHVLQEGSPWILYPKEVQIWTSLDGKEFSLAATVKNERPVTLGPSETQRLGTTINRPARYIRVKAVNGGKLPAWHESAGNSSHLFIDEVIVEGK